MPRSGSGEGIRIRLRTGPFESCCGQECQTRMSARRKIVAASDDVRKVAPSADATASQNANSPPIKIRARPQWMRGVIVRYVGRGQQRVLHFFGEQVKHCVSVAEEHVETRFAAHVVPGA